METAVDSLTWTFYYRRLLQNPNYYGIPQADQQYLSEHLSELVEYTIKDLIDGKCIEQNEEGEISALNLGLVSAHYYVSYETISLYSENIEKNKTIKVKGLLQILSESQEYSDVRGFL